MTSTGMVYLVGAGPGDPGLITVRGLECLRQADVVIYDRLLNKVLLDEAPAWAERVFVGKAPGAHTCRQEEINALIIERARAGQVVVRLKGGDPFVFGRGGEEVRACTVAGVRWEVVPGVTSAVSVPACAGIPVTHRGLSNTFAVITAHRADGQDNDLNWAAMAAIDTLVVLMGVGRMAHVVAMLTRHGRSPETSVAIIERGTQPGERIVTGTLGDIVEQAGLANIRPPATIVIGEVVRLRETLRHSEGVGQPVASRTGRLPASQL